MNSLFFSIQSQPTKKKQRKKGFCFVQSVCSWFSFLKCHEEFAIFQLNVFALVGSTQQGLTKAETIQVKGDECLCLPFITVMQWLNQN